LHLGGYQQRAKTLRSKITEAGEALEKANFSLEAFRNLQIGEEAGIQSRLEKLRGEVEFVSRREREAQETYRLRREELQALTRGAPNGFH
jgi:pre-mRNA-splicing factor CDC5/CEF1